MNSVNITSMKMETLLADALHREYYNKESINPECLNINYLPNESITKSTNSASIKMEPSLERLAPILKKAGTMDFARMALADELLQKLARLGVVLVEWEHSILGRFGLPSKGFKSKCFLVPDTQMKTVADTAASMGLLPVGKDKGEKVMPRILTCEYAPRALRYFVTDNDVVSDERLGLEQRRLVFAPLSWTGIHRRSCIPCDKYAGAEPRTRRSEPAPVHAHACYTVPLGTAAMAFLRLSTSKKVHRAARARMSWYITSIVTHCLLDTSQEPQYLTEQATPLSSLAQQSVMPAIVDVMSWPATKKADTDLRHRLAQRLNEANHSDLLASMFVDWELY